MRSSVLWGMDRAIVDGVADFPRSENGPLRTVRTDVAIAADLKSRIAEAYVPILAILDEAVSQGFIVQVSTGEGPFGKQAILQMQVLKKF
jgi:hypothetical protein